jgi:hypothetical protein
MALDPNIALGIRPMEVANPLAQYAQIAQLQNYQNQDALAQYQLGAAQRTEARDIARMNALAQAGTDETAIGNALLKSGDIKGYSDFVKATREGQKALIDMQDIKLKQSRGFLDNLDPSNPNAPAQYLAWAEANHNDPILGPLFAKRGLSIDQTRERVANAVKMGPQAFSDLVNQSKLGADRFIELNKPSVTPQDTGAGGRLISRPGLGGAATVVPGSEFTKTETFADKNAKARLAFDQAKFAWEKANPGYELKEDADGNFYGINKQTLQAVPVTIGGAAVAPAPAAPAAGGGIPGARMPAPDGAPVAPAAPAEGAPPKQLTGKGTAMTEGQSKSAMFGGAMNQANNIITKVEKEGTTTAPVAVSVLQGLARLSPQLLGSGENAASSIEALFRQDPTSILGPNVNQQKLGQAQVAFATAYLRATSGASFGPSEVANTIKEFFPLIGEDQSVVRQKAEARKRAIEGMKISTTKQGQSYIEKSGGNENDPLGLGVR